MAKLKGALTSVGLFRVQFPGNFSAADTDQRIMKAYDAVLPGRPEYANRTSCVIAPDGRILYAYTALNPDKHVEYTLEAVRQWAASRK